MRLLWCRLHHDQRQPLRLLGGPQPGHLHNRKTIKRTDVEDRVLAGLKHRLMAPELVAEFIAEFQREVQKDRIDALAARADVERRLTKVRKDIDSLITAITDGMYHPSMKARMDALEVDKADLEARLQDIPRSRTGGDPSGSREYLCPQSCQLGGRAER